MAHTTRDHPLTETRLARERGPSGHHSGADPKATALATASVGAGVLGIVAGFIPGLWVVALVLAGIALLTGVPTMRRGRGADGHRAARIGVVLGVVAVVVGLLNLGIWYDGFTYFTTGD